MSDTFSRTLRAVAVDSARGYVVSIAATSVLLLAAATWSALGFVDIYVTSRQGTFETEDHAHLLAPQVDGLVTAVNAVLGARVLAGDVVFELDSQAQQRALGEEQARHDAAERVALTLKTQIESEAAARSEASRALGATTAAASARVAIAKTTSEYSTKRGDMVSELRKNELVGGLDSLEAEQSRSVNGAQLRAQESDLLAVGRSGNVGLLDRDVRISSLKHDLASVEGEVATSDARINLLTYEIERRRIRAPVSGVIAGLSMTSPGATIHAGDSLGSIVSMEPVHVIAMFDPAESVGRVAAGELATLRVDQFPWTQYGTLQGIVHSAGPFRWATWSASTSSCPRRTRGSPCCTGSPDRRRWQPSASTPTRSSCDSPGSGPAVTRTDDRAPSSVDRLATNESALVHSGELLIYGAMSALKSAVDERKTLKRQMPVRVVATGICSPW